MFETSVVKSGGAVVAQRRSGLLAMSVALHSCVVMAVVVVSVAAVEFPLNAPDQLSRLMIAAPVTLPPALGRPDGGAKRAAIVPPKAQAERPVPPTQPTVPTTVTEITTHTESASTSVAEPVTADGDGSGTHEGPLGQPDGREGGLGTGGTSTGTGVGTGGGESSAESTIYRVGADVTSARVLQRVLPVYPPIMVRSRIPATVTVKCIVDRYGRVHDVEIVRSSFPPFNDAVIDAVRQWTFTPGTLRGRPVDTYFELTARFAVQ